MLNHILSVMQVEEFSSYLNTAGHNTPEAIGVCIETQKHEGPDLVQILQGSV